jgi:hypothetical protein
VAGIFWIIIVKVLSAKDAHHNEATLVWQVDVNQSVMPPKRFQFPALHAPKIGAGCMPLADRHDAIFIVTVTMLQQLRSKSFVRPNLGKQRNQASVDARHIFPKLLKVSPSISMKAKRRSVYQS